MIEFFTDFFEPPEALINEVDEAIRFFTRIRPTMWSSKPPGASIDEEFLKHNAVGSKVGKFFCEVAEEKARRGQHAQAAVRWRDVEGVLLLFDEFLNSVFYGSEESRAKHRDIYNEAQASLKRLIVKAWVCGIVGHHKRTTR